MVGIYDLLSVRFKTRDRANDRTGRDDDVFRFDRFLFAVGERDLDLAGTEDLSKAVVNRDLVLFHQVGHAGSIFRNDIRFVFLNAAPVVSKLLYLQSEVLEFTGFLIKMRRIEQCLGRNTAA